MLTRVVIEGFRCFRGATLSLGPLTALVGPNASGKTALLQAVTLHGIDPTADGWRRQPSRFIQIQWFDETHAYALRWDASGALVRGGLPNPAHRGQYLHLDVASMRAGATVVEARRIETDGRNLVNVFATLPRKVQGEIAGQLARLVPVVADVVATPGKPAGVHRLRFQDRWQPDLWYEPDQVSDATILTLALLVLQHQKEQVDVIGIEEPEHGLHPYLMGEIVRVLRKLSRGEVGPRPVQVVLATQSAELLEHLEPAEVRFLSRDPEDGAVRIAEAPTDTEAWREAYDAHQESLGSLWLSGGMGGVPGD